MQDSREVSCQCCSGHPSGLLPHPGPARAPADGASLQSPGAGRPPFKARSREAAEAFFLDALLQWQKEQGLDRVILMGHSLGGYLAATYALQHPERVQHLILVCPAGIVSLRGTGCAGRAVGLQLPATGDDAGAEGGLAGSWPLQHLRVAARA